MTPQAARLTDAFDAIARIGRRLDRSIQDESGLFPVDPVRLDERDRALAYDAFLKRFEQATDHLLRKLFPALVAAVEAEAQVRPLIDVLSYLHRARVIERPGDWLEINALRNRLVHDYALEPAMLALDLDLAWSIAPRLLLQIEACRDYAARHALFEKSGS